MATVTIARTATRAAPPPRQARAYIATDTGIKVVLPFAPRTSSIDGWADTFDTLERPGRRPLVRRKGDGLPALSFDVVLGRENNQHSVHSELSRLREIAYSGARVTIGGLTTSYERGPWRMTGCAVEVTMRAAGSNRITQATVSLSFLADCDVTPTPRRKGPTTGGHHTTKPKTKPKPTNRYYVMRRGDTLSGVALHYYGNPNKWPTIAKASGIRNTRTVKVGKRLTIPPIR